MVYRLCFRLDLVDEQGKRTGVHLHLPALPFRTFAKVKYLAYRLGYCLHRELAAHWHAILDAVEENLNTVVENRRAILAGTARMRAMADRYPHEQQDPDRRERMRDVYQRVDD